MRGRNVESGAAFKKRWRGSSGLKARARSAAANGDEDAKNWLHNKRVNPKSDKKRIGSTRNTQGAKVRAGQAAPARPSKPGGR